MSETDNTTPTTTTCPCENDLNSMKEHINVLNTEITALLSLTLEELVILKITTAPISDMYPEQNSQYINVVLEQIHHLCQENEKKLVLFKR